jgi:hypothetical protein
MKWETTSAIHLSSLAAKYLRYKDIALKSQSRRWTKETGCIKVEVNAKHFGEYWVNGSSYSINIYLNEIEHEDVDWIRII